MLCALSRSDARNVREGPAFVNAAGPPVIALSDCRQRQSAVMVIIVRHDVTDHAAERCAAERTDRTTVGEHGTADATGRGADCGIALLGRHIGTAARQGSYRNAYQCRLAKGS
jgi:hypothetical protein